MSSLGFGLAILVPGFGVLLYWGVFGGFWLVNILAKGFNVGMGLVCFVNVGVVGSSCGFGWLLVVLVNILAKGLTVDWGGFCWFPVGWVWVSWGFLAGDSCSGFKWVYTGFLAEVCVGDTRFWEFLVVWGGLLGNLGFREFLGVSWGS